MDQPLAGKSVLILIASGFEEIELTEPQRALLKAGAKIKTASVDTRVVHGWHGNNWGHYFPVDVAISEVLASDHDLLLLPGGERSINKLKQSAHTRRIINTFLDGQKPIAAIGRGLELLTLAGLRLKGQTLSAPIDLQPMIEAAGAQWTPEPMTVSRNIITAQNTEILPVFTTRMLSVFSGQETTNIQAA